MYVWVFSPIRIFVESESGLEERLFGVSRRVTTKDVCSRRLLLDLQLERFYCTLIHRNKYEKADCCCRMVWCCIYGDCINILLIFVMSFHDWLDKRQKIMIKAIHHDDAEVLNYDELLNDQGHNTPNQRVIVRIDSLQNF